MAARRLLTRRILERIRKIPVRLPKEGRPANQRLPGKQRHRTLPIQLRPLHPLNPLTPAAVLATAATGGRISGKNRLPDRIDLSIKKPPLHSSGGFFARSGQADGVDVPEEREKGPHPISVKKSPDSWRRLSRFPWRSPPGHRRASSNRGTRRGARPPGFPGQPWENRAG